MKKNLRLAIPLSFISMLFFPSATWIFFFSQHLNYQQIAGIMGVGAIVGIMLIVMRIASSTTFRNSRSVIINKEISSRNRATTLSTLTLLTELPYALGASLIGLYIDRTSPNEFAYLLGVGIVAILIIIFALRRSGSVFYRD